MKLQTFKETYKDHKELQKAVEGFNKFPAEITTRTNWFLDLDNFYETIYNIFTAKTFNKYFIWNVDTEEFEIGIKGFFLPTLFEEIILFFNRQLILVNNDLNELKDWKERGNLTFNNDSTGWNKNSNPTKTGIEWDKENDAPTSKMRKEADATVTNRINDLRNLMYSNITIRFNEIFFKFEKMFMHKRWLKGLI